MLLKINKKTIIEVEYTDLYEYIKYIYDVSKLEMRVDDFLDTSITFDVHDQPTSADIKYIKKCICNGYILGQELDIVLNMLCKELFIESGEYIINFGW